MPFRLLIQDEINPRRPIWIFGSMLLFSCAFGYAMARDMVAGLGVLGMIISIGTGFICMASEEAGLYLALVYSFFIYHFSRLLFNDDFPVGTGLEGMLLLTLLGMVIRRVPLWRHFQSFARSAIGRCVIFLLVGYNLLEVANPYGESILGWFQVIRKAIDMLIVLFICFTVFNSIASIRQYIKGLFIVTTIVALYGCVQQWHGLLPFERHWILEDPTRTNLIYIGGEYRKFSTLSDPKGFGIIMAASAVFFLILTMAQAKTWRRAALLGGCALMLLGMSYSGTRTANAMVVAGALIFILLTIDKQSTRIFAVFATAIFLLLMYAPIYGNSTLIRFRSTFSATHDQSYIVREVNRAFVQPYIYTHPFGAGLGTTGGAGEKYAPTNPLAGFPPDSGYLEKALEAGWIGLIFYMITYFTILQQAVSGYFSCKDRDKKWIYAASVGFFFSFYVGEYSQDAIGEIADLMVYLPMIAIIMNLKNFDSSKTSANEMSNVFV